MHELKSSGIPNEESAKDNLPFSKLSVSNSFLGRFNDLKK